MVNQLKATDFLIGDREVKDINLGMGMTATLSLAA